MNVIKGEDSFIADTYWHTLEIYKIDDADWIDWAFNAIRNKVILQRDMLVYGKMNGYSFIRPRKDNKMYLVWNMVTRVEIFKR